ncbi:hypothetical protein [Acinetobacter baumannii]|uniref:hypothetical protein n=1 Tax=Acinetobacter baumannii TaxID=470 RepID=UPI00066B96DE|nr:hypothetical protein [Acinetobacter baumannii]MCT6584215.1 hypothetical protein [Acinetobacter baumannii]MCT6587908.1 hypothetical protein [Acinetobacter baumannii]MCT6596080.1 hypothetical protein [Acinetobacter baumannii]MCT6656185.1 hypothetical protein [Acinetobacter baumannii]MCT6659738.1 hypothetical protein [Acinetobacter baumannii]
MQLTSQGNLGLFSVAETSINDLPMGVLSDGTPYLTIRGLTKICGAEHSSILNLVQNWHQEKFQPRGQKILELLRAQNYLNENLFISANSIHGDFIAIPDAVCMAILEYYAFDADSINKEVALTNYRILARSSFKLYVYTQCNYNPNQKIDNSWQAFHERLLLNDNIPINYFSIFKELSTVIVNMIRGGCKIDDTTVPDISVGQIWSRYWTQNKFDEVYGFRQKFPHVYPDTFRQSSGGEYEAWIYPADALGIFRKWLYEIYLMEKFPKYLNTKVTSGAIVAPEATKLLDVLQKPAQIIQNN